jgi:flagellar L-ring protein FlgH
MKKLIIPISILFIFVANISGFAQNSSRFQSMFSDYKAHKVGDLLTIHIVEFTSGSNNSTTNTKNENSLSVSSSSTGALDFIPLFGIGSKHGNEYKGNGSVSQNGQLRAKLSATIKDVTESGNVMIEGKKVVEINGDKQVTILTGIVRPEDITSENVVFSYNIANAEIKYEGKGVASSSAKPGWVTRLINWIF